MKTTIASLILAAASMNLAAQRPILPRELAMLDQWQELAAEIKAESERVGHPMNGPEQSIIQHLMRCMTAPGFERWERAALYQQCVENFANDPLLADQAVKKALIVAFLLKE